MYRHFVALNYAAVLMTRKPDSNRTAPAARIYSTNILWNSWLVASGDYRFAVGEKCISLWLERYRSSESILRPLDNGSMVQEDGNKAPCYPANTVIARSAHNGTLATHSSFRTHEPTEFQRKGVNLVNELPLPIWSLAISNFFFFFFFSNSFT